MAGGSMEALVDDVLLHVFALLDVETRLRLESVSARWRRLLRRLWRWQKRLDLYPVLYEPSGSRSFDPERRDRGLQAILSRCEDGCLSELILGPSTRQLLSSPTIARLPKFPLSHELLNSIALQGDTIRSLNLSSHIFPSVNFLAKLFRSLNLGLLESLRLDFVRIDAISEAEGGQGEKLLRSALHGMPKLRLLSLTGRGSALGHIRIGQDLLVCLPMGIESLSISSGLSLKLTQLHFVKRLRALRHLDVARSDIRSLEPLPSACPSLDSLNISYCRHLRDFAPLAQLANLRVLCLDGNRDHFENGHLEALCHRCPLLSELSLECCSRLSSVGCLMGSGLKALARLPRLRRLNLNGLLNFEDGGLAELCLSCAELQELEIRGCRKLTSRGLLGLAALSKLRFLAVSMVPDYSPSVHRSLVQAIAGLNYVEAMDSQVRLSDQVPPCRLAASIGRQTPQMPPMPAPIHH